MTFLPQVSGQKYNPYYLGGGTLQGDYSLIIDWFLVQEGITCLTNALSYLDTFISKNFSLERFPSSFGNTK